MQFFSGFVIIYTLDSFNNHNAFIYFPNYSGKIINIPCAEYICQFIKLIRSHLSQLT